VAAVSRSDSASDAGAGPSEDPLARDSIPGRQRGDRRPGLGVWLEAARPRTLPAAVAPIAVGSAVAAGEGSFVPWVAAVALGTALLLQIGANLANDVADFERGADGADRRGPRRATAAGLVSPAAMRWATAAVLAAAALLGMLLVWRGGPPIAAAGAASLAAALLYTGGPWPLGYHGLGDLLVFLFFGLVGVAGSHYVLALHTSPAAWAAAVPVGLLATAILAVNNLRDIPSDRRAGKRTLAVRLGDRATRRYYAGLVLGAPAVVAGAALAGLLPPGALLCLVAVPFLARLARAVARAEGAALNPLLGRTARTGTAFALLLAAGIATPALAVPTGGAGV